MPGQGSRPGEGQVQSQLGLGGGECEPGSLRTAGEHPGESLTFSMPSIGKQLCQLHFLREFESPSTVIPSPGLQLQPLLFSHLLSPSPIIHCLHCSHILLRLFELYLPAVVYSASTLLQAGSLASSLDRLQFTARLHRHLQPQVPSSCLHRHHLLPSASQASVSFWAPCALFRSFPWTVFLPFRPWSLFTSQTSH